MLEVKSLNKSNAFFFLPFFEEKKYTVEIEMSDFNE